MISNGLNCEGYAENTCPVVLCSAIGEGAGGIGGGAGMVDITGGTCEQVENN